MINSILQFLYDPISSLKDAKDYLIEGLLKGYTLERWELERTIKIETKILTYLEEYVKDYPSESGSQSLQIGRDKLKLLKSFRYGRKIKLLP